MLLIDDVQFLEGKARTADEFFHTFNALYEGGSQIVLSADRLPSELSELAARLRDRFEWGLVTELLAPDELTRPPSSTASPRGQPEPAEPEALNAIARPRNREPAPAARRPDPRHRPLLAHGRTDHPAPGRRRAPGAESARPSSEPISVDAIQVTRLRAARGQLAMSSSPRAARARLSKPRQLSIPLAPAHRPLPPADRARLPAPRSHHRHARSEASRVRLHTEPALSQTLEDSRPRFRPTQATRPGPDRRR